MIRVISLLLFLGIITTRGLAQEKENTKADSTRATADTTWVEGGQKVEKIISYANRYDPHKALLLAAVFPGAGQIYNNKYWKLPLVYGGLGLIVNAITFYQRGYVKFKTDLYYTLNTNLPSRTGYTQASLRILVDDYRRERDYFIVIGGLVYLLQMVDAHVDAHLKEFDLNPRLKVALRPHTEQNMMIGRTSGVSLVFKF